MSENDKISTEVVRRVYDDSEGTFIEVGPDSDGLGCVSVATTEKLSKEYFGEFRIALRPTLARAVGAAMIAAADEAEPQP